MFKSKLFADKNRGHWRLLDVPDSRRTDLGHKREGYRPVARRHTVYSQRCRPSGRRDNADHAVRLLLTELSDAKRSRIWFVS